jgi:hypothetical protein
MTDETRDRQEDSRTPRWPILLILFLAFGVRFLNIEYGLPFSLDAKEEKAVTNGVRYVIMFSPETLNAPKLSPIESPSESPLPGYITAGEYGALFALGRKAGKINNLQHFKYLFLVEHGRFVLMSRLVSVLLGVLAVYIVYKTCVIAFGWGIAVAASLFVAFSPHMAAAGRVANGEMFTVIFALLALFFLVRFGVDKRIGGIFYASILAGLAAGSSFGLMPLVIVIVFAYAVIVPKEYKVVYTFIGFVACLALFAVGVVMPNASAFIAAREAAARGVLAGFLERLGTSAIGGPGAQETLAGMVSPGIAPGTLGAGLLAAGVIGIFWGLARDRWKRRRHAFVLAFFFVTALAVFPHNDGQFALWAALVSAPLAIGASFLIYRIGWASKLPARAGAVVMVILALVIGGQGLLQTGVACLRKEQTDTRIAYAKWAETNLPDEAYVLVTDNARFLNDVKSLRGAGAAWKGWKRDILKAWNGRAFNMYTSSEEDWGQRVPEIGMFNYVAVDSWGEAALTEGAPDEAQAERNAAMLAAIDAARKTGRLVKVFDEKPAGIEGPCPRIEVYEIPGKSP